MCEIYLPVKSETIRAYAKQKCEISYAPIGVVSSPISNSLEDIAAARIDTFSIMEKSLWRPTWWLDPVFLGDYPEDGMKIYEKVLPKIGQNDMKIIHQPLDFCSLNIYNGKRVKMGLGNKVETVKPIQVHEHTALNWTITPEALYWGPKFFCERYGKPIVISENGLSNTDWIHCDGKVHDPQRIDFLNRYLKELKRAAKEGIEVKGYFYWSFMDNFEWTEGYNERFGLIYVDYPTQKRTIKDLGHWYKKVIETNGGLLGY